MFARLREDTSALVQGKDRLQRKLENYSIFHKYMEKALERGEEFHEMRDVIARYDTLTATHEVQIHTKIYVFIKLTVDTIITVIWSLY